MADNALFELKDKGGTEKKPPKRVWTQEEQTEALRGYLEINREDWPGVQYGVHVRYYTTEGDYRPGGFVLKNPNEIGDKIGIKLRNGFNEKAKGYLQWTANYDNISKLFVKMTAVELTLLRYITDSVKGLNANDKKIYEKVVKLSKQAGHPSTS